MQYKGIEYKILQTTTPDVWVWSFDPPKAVPVQGKTKGSRSLAVVAVERGINKWLRANTDEEMD
jgi:hypothetical protein